MLTQETAQRMSFIIEVEEETEEIRLEQKKRGERRGKEEGRKGEGRSMAELVSKAMALLADGDLDGADAAFAEAESQGIRTAELYSRRARVRNQLKRHDAALADAKKALELDADLWTALQQKGIALMALDEYESAATCLRKGLNKAPATATTARKEMEKLLAECNEDNLGE